MTARHARGHQQQAGQHLISGGFGTDFPHADDFFIEQHSVFSKQSFIVSLLLM